MTSRRARQQRAQEQFEQQTWQAQRDREQDVEDGLTEYPDNDDEPHYTQETFR